MRWLVAAALLGVACSSGGRGLVDAGSFVTPPVVDAATVIDLAACLEDAPAQSDALDNSLDGSLDGSTASSLDASLDAMLGSEVGPSVCVGDVALAGVTPLGAFAPTGATGAIGASPRAGLTVLLAEDPKSPFSGLELIFTIPWDAVAKTYVGVHEVSGLVFGGGTGVHASIVVDVTSATVPYEADGSRPASGEARMTITVTTGCGTFTGALVAPYCSWQVLI
jgi:hypothetical protein